MLERLGFVSEELWQFFAIHSTLRVCFIQLLWWGNKIHVNRARRRVTGFKTLRSRKCHEGEFHYTDATLLEIFISFNDDSFSLVIGITSIQGVIL